MKSPKWHRDEIILALDLYHSLDSSEMNKTNLKVIELSGILNNLPIHEDREENLKFRNPNGVGLKLSNFKAIDPDHAGKGMTQYSKDDKEIFFEFKDKVVDLKAIATQIKSTIANLEINNKLFKIRDESQDGEQNIVREGKVIFKLHKLRERNSQINKKKKSQYFKKYGKLDCEVCGFDFYEFYGNLGMGYIEAHHKLPLSKLDGETKTRLEDLALVCSNCHRMLHREIDSIDVVALKKSINL